MPSGYTTSKAASARRPAGPFVLAFGANLDPADGAGRREVMQALLAHPQLQDPRPKSQGAAAAATPAHLGDPALDTADWAEPTADTFGPGNMRVDFLLPSADVTVSDAGVFWPALHIRGPRARPCRQPSPPRLD